MLGWTEDEHPELRGRMITGYLFEMVDVWPEHEQATPCSYCGLASTPLEPEQLALQLLTNRKPGWGSVVTRCRDHRPAGVRFARRRHSEIFHARRRAYGAERALAMEAADS